MKKIVLLGLLLLGASACQSPGERAPLTPLPEKVISLRYAELLTRARTQAAQANDAFYVDRWAELEELARGLEQTARYMLKAEDVPAKHKDTLPVAASDLGKYALSLREAAAVKDVKKATEALQRINLKVRELRLSS